MTLAVAVLLITAPGTAGAPSGGAKPLPVSRSTVVQQGTQLIWRLTMARPFSPSAVRKAGGNVCLLIERLHPETVAGGVCVEPPRRRGKPPRLFYARVTRNGPRGGHFVPAKLLRRSDREVSASFPPSSVGLTYHSFRWQVMSSLRPPACVPATPNRAGCVSLYPATPALAKLHTPRVVGCIPSGPAFVYDRPAAGHVIALTFDDGPWPDTPQFLDILERKHVHATFFQIGDQVSEYGGGVDRRMLRDGDMIGDHTWDHQDVSGGGSFARWEISDAAAAIHQITGGFTPCLFRAPYGDVSQTLISEARSMGFTTIQWDVDPSDWSLPGSDAIYNNVVDNAHNGAIVIQHDGGGDRSETIAALPREIDTLRREGYRFVTVTQLLGQKLIYR